MERGRSERDPSRRAPRRSVAPPLAFLVAAAPTLALAGCSGATPRGPDAAVDSAATPDGPDATLSFAEGVLSTDLTLDLSSLRGRAAITHAPADTIVLEVGDLASLSVTDEAGAPVDVAAVDGTIRLPGDPEAEVTYVFEYAFAPRSSGTLQGWVPTEGFTFLWPYFCGNLFPCVSSPRDGTTFTLSVDGVPSGQRAVYPSEIPAAAPAYMVAIAVGDYRYELLGTTTAGTDVGVYYFAGEGDSAREGTANLRDVFDFFERTYGDYLFGGEVASVAATWGPSGGLGGMEHHPYFHVARPSMASEVVQAHEAAHGWFGNGVRMRCWEDFVLSEGVTTYLASRGLRAAAGPTMDAEVWAGYEADLRNAVSRGDTEAWPAGCDTIDILEHPVWSSIPYTKGAFFLREVELEVGTTALDGVLADFYLEHAGSEAASMGDLVAAIERNTGFDPGSLVEKWLRSRGLPELPPLP